VWLCLFFRFFFCFFGEEKKREALILCFVVLGCVCCGDVVYISSMVMMQLEGNIVICDGFVIEGCVLTLRL